MRVYEKHMAVEGEVEELKLIADALDYYSRAMGIDLPKHMGDLRFAIEANYQEIKGLDKDEWEMTEDDREHFGIHQNDGDYD